MRLATIGNIRVGMQVPISNPRPNGPKTRPASSETFILTSASQAVLEDAKSVYGGEISPFPGNRGQYQLVTETQTLKAIMSMRPLNPSVEDGDTESLSQHFEVWEKGVCLKRCDGCLAKIPTGKNGEVRTVDCSCDPDEPECKLVSRLNVMLSEIDAMGMWGLRTQSQFFDEEVNAFISALRSMRLETPFVPVIATLTRRQTYGEDKKHFSVVTLTVDPSPISPAELIRRLQLVVQGLPGDPPALVVDTAAPALPTPVDAPEEEGAEAPTTDWPVFGGNADAALQKRGITSEKAWELSESGVRASQILVADRSAETNEAFLAMFQ